MNSGNLIVLGIVVLIVALLAISVYTGSPKRGENRRGTAPGKGETVRHVHISAQTPLGMSQTITTRHTKDPQKHATAMMPAKARKKDKSK